jgi:hypothetical protein
MNMTLVSLKLVSRGGGNYLKKKDIAETFSLPVLVTRLFFWLLKCVNTKPNSFAQVTLKEDCFYR